jgi:hypothetical protein
MSACQFSKEEDWHSVKPTDKKFTNELVCNWHEDSREASGLTLDQLEHFRQLRFPTAKFDIEF